jgi:hypothetical protein
MRLQDLAGMCNHEIETLLWPHAVELPPGHELFTLVSYVKACSGNPDFPLVTDLLGAVYKAYGRRPPSRDAIEKQVERFGKLKADKQLKSVLPEVIEERTQQMAQPGELKQGLLTRYPSQSPR